MIKAKSLVLILFVFYCSNVSAFTLVPSRLKFPVSKVSIFVSGNPCANNGLTPGRLLDLAEEAVNEFWNRVPTSTFKITKGDISSSIDLSADTLGDAAGKASANTILVGCSGDSSIFDDATILGVGSIAQKGDGSIVGALLINDALVGGENRVSSLPDHELKAVIAHEIGHAIGLGHSGNPIALMYYAVGDKVQERLTQDDYDGITYLYPHSSPGGCGQIMLVNDENGDDENGPLPFAFTFLVGVLMSFYSKIRPYVQV